MSTLVGIAMSAGIALGQLIAGMMGPVLGWRSPFLVISIPCLLCGLLVMFTCVEPVRGGQEEEVLVMRRAREKFVISSPPSRTYLSEINEDVEDVPKGLVSSTGDRRQDSVLSRGNRSVWEEDNDTEEEEKKGSSMRGLGLRQGQSLGSDLSSSSVGIHRPSISLPPSIHPSYGATNGIETTTTSTTFTAIDRDMITPGVTPGIIGTMGTRGNFNTMSYTRTFTSGSDEGGNTPFTTHPLLHTLYYTPFTTQSPLHS